MVNLKIINVKDGSVLLADLAGLRAIKMRKKVNKRKCRRIFQAYTKQWIMLLSLFASHSLFFYIYNCSLPYK